MTSSGFFRAELVQSLDRSVSSNNPRSTASSQ